MALLLDIKFILLQEDSVNNMVWIIRRIFLLWLDTQQLR